MTRFVGTPLRGTEFANAGDEAISTRVTTDPYPRVRIDAGGRITWASGSATGDTTLYRGDADLLKTDDVFQALSGVITLTTDGAPTQALPNGAIAVDITNHVFYFRSNGAWQIVSGGGATLTVDDAAPADPEEGDLWFSSLTLDTFVYYSSAWLQINDPGDFPTELYELVDVIIADPVLGETLVYNGTEWENTNAAEEVSFTVAGGTTGTQPTFDGAPLFSGSYIRTGALVHFQIQVDMDNITSFGTGQYYVDLPFSSKYGYKFREGCLHDISTGKDYEIGGHVAAGLSRMTLTSMDTQSGTVFDIAFTYNSPVTLSTADNFHVSGTYITNEAL